MTRQSTVSVAATTRARYTASATESIVIIGGYERALHPARRQVFLANVDQRLEYLEMMANAVAGPERNNRLKWWTAGQPTRDLSERDDFVVSHPKSLLDDALQCCAGAQIEAIFSCEQGHDLQSTDTFRRCLLQAYSTAAVKGIV